MAEKLELLPCPMCGCAATFVKHSAGMPNTQAFDKWDSVTCKHCRTTVGVSDRRFRCREDAAAAWNLRVPAAPPPAGAQQAVAISDEQIIRAIQEVLRGYSIFSPVLLANQVGTWNHEDVLTKEGRAIADRILALTASAAAQRADCARCKGVGAVGDHNGERAVEISCDHCGGTGRAPSATPAPEAAPSACSDERLCVSCYLDKGACEAAPSAKEGEA